MPYDWLQKPREEEKGGEKGETIQLYSNHAVHHMAGGEEGATLNELQQWDYFWVELTRIGLSW